MRSAVVIAVLVSAAAAEPVTVKVIEVAGGIAYVTPGRAAGLAPGAKVKLRGRELVVIESTEKTASLRVEGTAIAIGDTGSANVDRATASAIQMLPKPHAAAEFAGQWPDAVHPADAQTPTPVPLGEARAGGAAHVTVIGHGYGVVGKGNSAADGEARVIASFDVMRDRPLAIDADVAGRAFSEGYDSSTHTPLFVRAAQIRYGNAYDPQFAAGRLRFAASSVGMLDGGRAAMRLGNFELAAFGGLVPDPLSGKPDTSASRFGSELVLDDRKSSWQPRVALVAYGSTWQGKLDERRLSLVASANHGTTWLDGWAEAQQFPSDNPWGAKAVELTGGGATYEWREHGDHAGVGVTYLRPERSLRLAAALPPSWLCTLAPQIGNVPNETCSGGDYWVQASANAGLRTGRWSLDGVGTVGESHGVYRGYDASVYVRGEMRMSDTYRLIAGVSAGQASFAVWRAAELGVGATLGRGIDGVVTYRPEQLDYNAATGVYLLHSIIVDGHYALSRSFDVGGSALATVGADRDALAVLATFVWRPLP
jgi:hypothetical protein